LGLVYTVCVNAGIKMPYLYVSGFALNNPNSFYKLKLPATSLLETNLL